MHINIYNPFFFNDTMWFRVVQMSTSYEEKRGFTSIYLSITHIKELQYSNIYLSSIT